MKQSNPPMTQEREEEMERAEFRKFVTAVLYIVLLIAGLLSWKYAYADMLQFSESMPAKPLLVFREDGSVWWRDHEIGGDEELRRAIVEYIQYVTRNDCGKRGRWAYAHRKGEQVFYEETNGRVSRIVLAHDVKAGAVMRASDFKASGHAQKPRVGQYTPEWLRAFSYKPCHAELPTVGQRLR